MHPKMPGTPNKKTTPRRGFKAAKKTTIAGANGGVIGGCRGSRGTPSPFIFLSGAGFEVKTVLPDDDKRNVPFLT
jgi:hypothetical protein